MKIALISDIHGNLPALEAVLDDIESKNIDKILCLGDLIGKGPNSPETVDICKKRCDEVITGNWDKFMANTDVDNSGTRFFKGQLGQERLDYLKDLPEFLEFYLSGKLVRLFHAHPSDVFKRIYASSDLNERISMFSEPSLLGESKFKGESDIAGYGDIHWAYIQNVNGKILFNTGSVGNPLDLPLASYVVLEGEYGSKTPSSFSTQFYRVPYNIELAVKQAKENNIPQLEKYVQEVRTAIYCKR